VHRRSRFAGKASFYDGESLPLWERFLTATRKKMALYFDDIWRFALLET